MTVADPVLAGELGIITMHKHLWMDSSPLLAVHGYDPAAGVDTVPWDAAVAAEARWNLGVTVQGTGQCLGPIHELWVPDALPAGIGT